MHLVCTILHGCIASSAVLSPCTDGFRFASSRLASGGAGRKTAEGTTQEALVGVAIEPAAPQITDSSDESDDEVVE